MYKSEYDNLIRQRIKKTEDSIELEKKLKMLEKVDNKIQKNLQRAKSLNDIIKSSVINKKGQKDELIYENQTLKNLMTKIKNDNANKNINLQEKKQPDVKEVKTSKDVEKIPPGKVEPPPVAQEKEANKVGTEIEKQKQNIPELKPTEGNQTEKKNNEKKEDIEPKPVEEIPPKKEENKIEKKEKIEEEIKNNKNKVGEIIDKQKKNFNDQIIKENMIQQGNFQGKKNINTLNTASINKKN